jgi:ribosomal protein S12 methylthiotransferase accessory factor
MGSDAAREALGAIGRYATEPDPATGFLDTETTVPAETVGPASVSTGRDELAAVLDRLADSDLTAYASRTTTRDVEQLGFEAVRALVPGTQPLTFGNPYFGNRIERIPTELGFETRTERDHHPFP